MSIKAHKMAYSLIRVGLQDLSLSSLYRYRTPLSGKHSKLAIKSVGPELGLAESFVVMQETYPYSDFPEIKANSFHDYHCSTKMNILGPVWLISIKNLPSSELIAAQFQAARLELNDRNFTIGLALELQARFPWLTWWATADINPIFYSNDYRFFLDYQKSKPLARLFFLCRLSSALYNLGEMLPIAGVEKDYPIFGKGRNALEAVYKTTLKQLKEGSVNPLIMTYFQQHNPQGG